MVRDKDRWAKLDHALFGLRMQSRRLAGVVFSEDVAVPAVESLSMITCGPELGDWEAAGRARRRSARDTKAKGQSTGRDGPTGWCSAGSSLVGPLDGTIASLIFLVCMVSGV